ncbi:MAG: thioester reductase domain-containing protein [Actinobacteria bacterium]|nr:thioester reductase domain-containing protein [Actinomycetota bacterium]
MQMLDTDRCLHQLFRLQVDRTPEAPALVDADTRLTYRALQRRVTALATHLRADGVGAGVPAGVLMERSADYVVACLAILEAGGAFVALELAYPPDLLADVIEDAQPRVVLTRSRHSERLAPTVPRLLLDGTASYATQAGGPMPDDAAPPAGGATPSPASLAFVSYSSGTTGRSKGIANPHRAPVRSYARRFAVHAPAPGDRVACNVFFIWEMLRPLLVGATVVVVADDVSYDPAALIAHLRAERVTETLMTPSLLATVLVRTPDLGAQLPDLRVLWLNGEVVTTSLARRSLAALPDVRILNVYSASESHEIAAGDVRDLVHQGTTACPVGAPLDRDHTYVLDEQRRRVAPGEDGELYVGGDCLASHYLNLPDTTAAAFVPDPFADAADARMYRTGDRARMLASGVLEVTGRVGSMVKIRGYSIEPGAVEHALERTLTVRGCAVVATGDDGADRELVAYVVRDDGPADGRTHDWTVDAVGRSPTARRALRHRLPDYMLPSLWVELDALPLQEATGKADRRRLPDPPMGPDPSLLAVAGSSRTGRGGGKDVTASQMARLWATVLDVAPSSVTSDADFFELGGHSLAIAELGAHIVDVLGVDVPLAELVRRPTVAGHLTTVRAVAGGGDAASGDRIELGAEVVLDDEIRPPAAGALRPLRDADRVLLTGATGFLGGFLLDTLLTTTSAQVTCLVRADDDADSTHAQATDRLRASLVRRGLWREEVSARVDVVPGDLAAPRLGLSPQTHDELAAQIDAIVHAGAQVNLMYPYDALRDVNVGGTREVLRLACDAGGAAVHHVSTNGVLPPSTDGWAEDADLDAVAEGLPDGYGQSKWVAEQLVHETGRRGLPVRVYRPGTISGHSATGETNARDLLGALIVESLRIGHAPNVDGWYAEMTPVDYVSRAISVLADDADTDQHVFHLADPDPLPADAVFDRLADLGYPTRRVGWDDWVELWHARRGGVDDRPDTVEVLRGGMPSVSTLRAVTVLDDTATAPSLRRHALRRPRIGTGLLATYARHYHARGWLDRPPRHVVRASGGGSTSVRTSREPATDGHRPWRRAAAGDDARPAVADHAPPDDASLAGRVAVITGASSGIGAAIAGALAREGAHVALAARRGDALRSVRSDLEPRHGARSLTLPTDVTDRAQVEALVRTTEDELGPVDILVSCAGVMYYTLLANARTDEWDRTVDVNCKGLLHCLASTVPAMVARGRGHVLAISSDAGRKVFPGLGVYSASKFFVEATLQSLRLETAETGLKVTSVQPGNVATGLLGLSTDREALERYGQPTGARVLDPTDVAAAVVGALRQPDHVAVNEVLIEPRAEPI